MIGPQVPSFGAVALVRGATPRALALSLLAAVFINLASPYTESTGFSNFSWSYLPEGAGFWFLGLLAVNALVVRLRPRWALTVPELLFVFCAALAANCTSIFLMYFLCSAIVSPHYFASAENRWDEELIPYLRPWLIVSDERRAARWFYEGLPPGQPVPWRDWLVPLGAWLPFLMALLVASFALVALFRRQWLEYERLSYPIMRIPLELVGRGPAVAHSGTLTRRPGFWIAALIPFTCGVLDLIHGLVPSFRCLPMDHLGSVDLGTIRPGPHFPDLLLRLNFLGLSSAFFVPTDVLFAVWSLYLFFKLVSEPIVNRVGLGAGSAGMFVWGPASTAWQSFGAFTVMTVGMLLSARGHLRSVLARAGAAQEADGSSARTSLTALATAVAVMVGWLAHTGMSGPLAAVFVALVLGIYLGVARIVCQTGIFYLVPPMVAQNPIIYALGPETIGRQGMISLGLSYSWHGDVQTILSALAAQGMKVEQQAPLGRGELSLAMLGSAFVGLIVAPLGIILTGYPRGALAWNTWVYRGWGPNTYGQVLGQIHATGRRDWFNAGYFLLGLLGMLGLSLGHSRFAWWPLHPIGLAAVSSFTMYTVYLAFLVAWVAKVCLLRWGGFRAYRGATPFFVGLGVGHYLCRALALIGYTVLRIRWTT